jgi:hypothetical protein
MQRTYWNRLEALERKTGPDMQIVTVFMRPDESHEDVERKVEQWQAGGELDGPTDTPYLGGDLTVAIIRFVSNLRS